MRDYAVVRSLWVSARARRLLLIAVVAVPVLLWACVPLVRALQLTTHGPVVAAIHQPGVAMDDVVFTASDGVHLRGTLLPQGPDAPVVILVHGFRTTRREMLGRALFLHDAGYAVLLYDSRGCGESEGTFGVGATEERDVRGAVDLLRSRGLHRVAVLGISLGAGTALLAAANDPRIAAVIADSAWADESFQIDRMRSVTLGPLTIPLLPYEPWLVDRLIGGRLEDASPLAHVAAIAPRPLLLIHSNDDENATTPPSGAKALYAAAGEPKELWLLPHGGHVGAFSVEHDEYVRRILAFLDAAMR